MNNMGSSGDPACGGLLIRGNEVSDALTGRQLVLSQLQVIALAPHVLAACGIDTHGPYLSLRLTDAQAQIWAPRLDTLHLCERLQLDTLYKPDDLTTEIVVAMLLGRSRLSFPA